MTSPEEKGCPNGSSTCHALESEHEEYMDRTGRGFYCPQSAEDHMKMIADMADHGTLADDWFLM